MKLPLPLFTALLLAPLAALHAADVSKPAKSNVLFIIADDLTRSLPCYPKHGHTRQPHGDPHERRP